MNPEIYILALLFIVSSLLVFLNLKAALSVLLVLSVLLHKELFSIYRWDVLPVRIFMIAFAIVSGINFVMWLTKGGDISKNILKALRYLKDPFVVFLLLLWLIRAVSLIFTKNLPASVFLLGFFTTMVVLGLVLYKKYLGFPEEVLTFIKYYIYIVFGLSLIAFIQIAIYFRYDFIFGAFWNIPGHMPRVGSLFWDVNHFGGLLAGLLPVVGVFILTSEKLKHKVGYFLLAVPMGVVLLLTNSRTSWISALVSFLFFITLLLVRKFGYKALLYISLVIVLISIPIAWEYGKKASPFRAEVKQYLHYRMDSFDSHLLLIKGTWQVFDKYPYLGGGYGSFFEHFSKTKVAAEFFGRDPAALNVRVPAHTIWGEVLSETGAVGFIVFTLFILTGLVPLVYLALRERSREKYLISAGMSASIVGWLSAGIFYSYNSEFFFLIFFFFFIYGLGTLGRDKWMSAYKALITSEKYVFVFLMLLTLGLVLLNLGKNHLLPWDEAIYANIARNMTESGEYIVQNWKPGVIWYEKPPLFMWMMGGAMNLFGVSEFSARLPSAVMGIASVLLVYFIGKRMFNKTTGFIAAIVLLTTFNYLYYARASMLDVTATFFITAGIFSYWLAKSRHKVQWWLLAGVLTGLAVMVKGVVGFIPFGVFFFYELYLFFTAQQKINRHTVTGYLVMLLSSVAVFLPWHFEMYRRFGQAFLDNYIGYHVLDRATSAIEDKGRPLYWYIIVMKVSMRLWFVALIPALALTVSRILKKDNRQVFLAIWAVFIFVLFSLATSKLKWYIVPIYPATALTVAWFFERMIVLVVSKNRLMDNVLLKGFLVGTLVFGSVFYLFLNKELLYESDLTGPQALLLQQKDTIFGTEDVVYADRIDLPLILYYSASPYEVVDFRPLKEKLESAQPGERVLFVTKVSRFERISETIPNLLLIGQQKEWVLGYYSDYYLTDKDLKKVLILEPQSDI